MGKVLELFLDLKKVLNKVVTASIHEKTRDAFTFILISRLSNSYETWGSQTKKQTQT